MSLCAGRMKELKGDLIRDERKVVTPRSPIFFRPLLKILILQVAPIIFSVSSAIFMAECPQPKLIL